MTAWAKKQLMQLKASTEIPIDFTYVPRQSTGIHSGINQIAAWSKMQAHWP
jgi:hypothetical protein